MYRTVFIGAGPANLSTILNLEDQSNILLIEKGKNILERPKKEVIYGFGGAGAFSDFKLSYGYEVGGSLLDHIDEATFDAYIPRALAQYQQFTPKELIWSNPTVYEIPGLEMITQKVIHVGTAEGYNILTRIYDYLKSHNIDMMYDTEVVDMVKLEDGTIELTTANGEKIYAQQVVLGTGQKDKLVTKYFSHLEAKHKKFQLGVRVEVPNDDDRFADILAANYDFKYYKRYETENFNVRVRTFCCNSGNAHVAVEQANGLTSYNGHAIGDGQKNGLCNFGVICEMMPKNDSFGQVNFMAQVKAVNDIMAENPYDFEEDFNQTYVGLPEIDACIADFLRLFNGKCKITDGHFYTPEYKNTSPSYDYNGTLNELEENIYLNGDIFCTRGIITSSACGIMTADTLNMKLNKTYESEGKPYTLRR